MTSGAFVVQAFIGSSMEDLRSAIVEGNLAIENELVIDAQEDEEFWISVGR